MGLPGPDRLYSKAKKVPQDTQVFNKTGSTAMCCGDMGILVARGKNGASYPYIVVGIIESSRRNSAYGSWISRRADVIREVSNLVYLSMKQRHSL
jgi:beta-lactamase class A